MHSGTPTPPTPVAASPPLTTSGAGRQQDWDTGREIRFKKTRSCCNYLGHLPETQLSHLYPHLSHSLRLGVISMSFLAG